MALNPPQEIRKRNLRVPSGDEKMLSSTPLTTTVKISKCQKDRCELELLSYITQVLFGNHGRCFLFLLLLSSVGDSWSSVDVQIATAT